MLPASTSAEVVTMLELVLVVLAIGMFLGFFLGRSTAERGRARSDMGKIWSGRQGYRK